MDRLKKMLSEAKGHKEQINIIAEAICEDPDIDLDRMVAEGMVGELSALLGYVAGLTKQIVKGKPGIDQRLAEITDKSEYEIAAMSPEDKRMLLLKSIRDLSDKVWDDTQSGMHVMGI